MVDDTGVVAYVSQTSDGGDDAALEGVLELRDSCIVVDDQSQHRTVLPVFQQARVSWDGSSLTQDGKMFSPGESIDLRGGYSQAPSEADFVPTNCSFDGAFYVGPRD